MSRSVDRLLQAAPALPDQEQLQPFAAQAPAVDERGLRPFDGAWLDEFPRRSAGYDAGPVRPVSWAEIREEATPRITDTTLS
jgi:hypothetical protein